MDKPKYVTDLKVLSKKTPLCKSVDEGLEIATQLEAMIDADGDSIGLAANQVGINKSVAVVKVGDRKPIILINPSIEKKEDEFTFVEGCLSMPGVNIFTRRYSTIEVRSAAYDEPLVLVGSDKSEKKELDEDGNPIVTEEQKQALLEAVCVQHEVDHLNGILMTKRQIKREPIVKQVKEFARNEKITIVNSETGEEKVIKYKKAAQMTDKTNWEIKI